MVSYLYKSKNTINVFFCNIIFYVTILAMEVFIMNSSLNAIEVAQMLNITKNTVYEMIKRGELPSYKVGRKIRIDKSDVENYIYNQKNSSSNKSLVSSYLIKERFAS